MSNPEDSPKLSIDTTTTGQQPSQVNKGKSVLYSPIPKKPPVNADQYFDTPKPINSNTTTSATTTTTTTGKRERMPSLVVKQDPNLKSCLSQPSTESQLHLQQSEQPEQQPTSSDWSNVHPQQPTAVTNSILDVDHHFENQHPQFLATDSVSPTMHGLLNSPPSSRMVTSPTNIDHIITPMTAPSQPGSVSSSAISKSASPIQQQPQQQIPSRVNSLRYNNDNDKKYIDYVRHSSNNGSKSSTSINNVVMTEEYLTHAISHPINGPEDDKIHLLIGITGCISIHENIFNIIEKLFELYPQDKLEIQVILTKTAEWFLGEKLNKLEQLGVSKIWFSNDGEKYFLTSPFQNVYSKASTSGNLTKHKLTVPQILQQFSLSYELQRWTDVLLLAPLSANTVAKLINGLADNLLTEILHVWPIPQVTPAQQQQQQQQTTTQDTKIMPYNINTPKPIVAALAFTSAMYSHPITKKQLALLQETYPNMSILKPVEKFVDIDGNISMGGMRAWREVVEVVCNKLGPPYEPEDDDDEENEDNDECDDTKEEQEEEEDDEDDDDDDDDEDDGDTPDEEEVPPEYFPTERSKSPQPVTRAKLEIHDDDEKLEPIIDSRKSSVGETTSNNTSHTRKRSSTITARELQEHEKLASQNAIINSGIGIVSGGELPMKCPSMNSIQD
ncbi:Coenzyme A biosynthesis protein 3 [Spathaspora sp. JA1]|nr:Coenzyme A biosynthesis protein 3 [Spathaspora sp. JA1]